MPLPSPTIILLEPQMGENIGAAARAMLNFGLTDLRLINPRDGWPNQAAIHMSSGALDTINPQLFETLEDAIADLNYVLATTARPRDMVKPIFTPRTAASEIQERSETGQKTGFLFGRERNGLENDEIARCQGLITVPTNPDFSSLNLGQSVLLLAYEWFSASTNAEKQTLPPGDNFPVSQEKLEEFLIRLDQELENHNFYKTENLKPTMQRNIRNIFTRTNLTDQETRTLHGILSAFIK